MYFTTLLPFVLLTTLSLASPVTQEKKSFKFVSRGHSTKHRFTSKKGGVDLHRLSALSKRLAARHLDVKKTSKKLSAKQHQQLMSYRNQASMISTAGITSGSLDMVDYFGQMSRDPNAVETDVSYFTSVTLGSENQAFNVVLDTGSSDLTIPIVPLGPHPVYLSGSSTYSSTSVKTSITYGSGKVSGVIAQETITLAGFTLKNQGFLALNAADASMQQQMYYCSGVLGLAFQAISSTKQPTFMDTLIKHNALTSNLFAFHYVRAQTANLQVISGLATGSIVSIGALDTNHYQGEVAYTKVIRKDYWTVQANSPVVNGISVGAMPFETIIDTGTSLIYLPTAVTQAIYQAISPLSVSNGDGSYQFPCNSTATVGFSFPIGPDSVPTTFYMNQGDISLGPIHTGSSMCVGSIQAQDVTGATNLPLGTIGDSFIKQFYTVFNYDAFGPGIPGVGFATSI